MFDLSNKNILIFGGTGELMGKIAVSLHESNANVIIVGRTLKENMIIYDKIKFYKFDINKDNIEDLFKKIYQDHDKIDMLINGAGVNSATPFLEISEEEMKNIFEINYIFVVKCCQQYIKQCLQQKCSGKILNIGSVSGLNPLSKVFTYSASKSALHNLSKNLAREYGEKNICTNILIPGFFPAEQNKAILSVERTQQIYNMTPMNRFGNPDELTGMVNLLASDASSFINGSELVIDGGYNVKKI